MTFRRTAHEAVTSERFKINTELVGNKRSSFDRYLDP